MMKRVVLLGVLLAALVVALPVTASGLTKKRADAIALRVLHPQAGKKSVILFGLPAPLPAGTAVVPADPPKGGLGRAARTRVTRLKHASWLYWLDQVPYAKFSHPSRYLLVDDATGKVVKQGSIRWYPTINGRRPTFVTPSGYRSKRFRVYARTATRATASTPAPSVAFSLSWPLANVDPKDLENDCVLIVSDYADPAFLNDEDAFSSFFKKLKVKTFFATGTGPDPQIPGSSAKPVDGAGLRKNVSELTDKRCADILLYITAHGLSAKEGPPTAVTKVKVSIGKVQATGVTAQDIASVLDGHPSATFKLKIDSCYSGRFRDALTFKDASGRPEPKFRNLLIIENSSSAKQVSSFANDGVDGNDNANHLSEFTNQNLTGLTHFFDSPTAIAAAKAQGGSLLAHALDAAFDDGASVNHAVDENGNKIPPQKFTNFGPPALKPQLKPIHAVFTPAPPGQHCSPPVCTTVYTEKATGEDLTYRWKVEIGKDPDCAKGFQPNMPQPNQATWYHADTTEGGPCDHAVYQENGRGHPGTVTVTVSNAGWTCTATYFGTQGDNGSTVGDGDPPQDCVRR